MFLSLVLSKGTSLKSPLVLSKTRDIRSSPWSTVLLRRPHLFTRDSRHSQKCGTRPCKSVPLDGRSEEVRRRNRNDSPYSQRSERRSTTHTSHDRTGVRLTDVSPPHKGDGQWYLGPTCPWSYLRSTRKGLSVTGTHEPEVINVLS